MLHAPAFIGAWRRWGATLIAYRRDRLEARGGHAVRDWCDLLQPQLEGRVAMTDSSREFLGAALKAALPAPLPGAPAAAAATGEAAVAKPRSAGRRGGEGGSSQPAVAAASGPAGGVGFNSCAEALAARGVGAEEVAEAARALRRQVRLFSSRDHIRAFSAGARAGGGWAGRVLESPLRSRQEGGA